MSHSDFLHTSFLNILESVSPKKLIQDNIIFDNNILKIKNSSYKINKKITLLGSGKAVLPMAEALHEILGSSIKTTTLVGQSEYSLKLENTNYIQSTHPLPTSKSITGAKAIIKSLESLEEDDFFIYLLSGGNSSLVELPANTISLEEFSTMTDLMLKNALPIEGINCVRKHISQVKGGNLAKFTKAKGLVLVLSDVLGNDLMAIGSAPLYCDATSFDQAISYLKKYNIWQKAPLSIQQYLEKKENETPKLPSKNIKHIVLGSNESVLENAKKLFEQQNIPTKVFLQSINHNVEELPCIFQSIIHETKEKKIALIFGGEATVKVTRDGKGGRNQHLALLMAKKIQNNDDVTFLSSATDGRDGNSTACGAIVDAYTLQKAKQYNLDVDHYLENFDSNSYLKITQSLIETGLTNNNLLDIVIIFIDKKQQKDK